MMEVFLYADKSLSKRAVVFVGEKQVTTLMRVGVTRFFLVSRLLKGVEASGRTYTSFAEKSERAES